MVCVDHKLFLLLGINILLEEWLSDLSFGVFRIKVMALNWHP
jgi:hypothetical protein